MHDQYGRGYYICTIPYRGDKGVHGDPIIRYCNLMHIERNLDNGILPEAWEVRAMLLSMKMDYHAARGYERRIAELTPPPADAVKEWECLNCGKMSEVIYDSLCMDCWPKVRGRNNA